MTFSEFEVSPDAGSPVEIYEFKLGSTSFRYTNVERDFTFSGNVYTSTPVTRSPIVSSLDNKNSQVNIGLPGNDTFARLYIGIIPGEFPEVTIRQLHRADPDAEAIFVFQGFVSTVGFSDDLHQADLACRPSTSSSGRIIPRHTFQGLCNHMLYDARCTIVETDREEFPTVESVNGRVLTVDTGQLTTEVDLFWTAGFIQFGNEFRTITAQTAREMTLDLPFLNDPTGLAIRILPGCDHLISGDCLNTFNNVINHGGFAYGPLKNPFETGLD